MKKEIKDLVKFGLICFFIGFCISALILSPLVYEKGLKSSRPCLKQQNFTFIQDKEVFYEGQYNFTGLGEE